MPRKDSNNVTTLELDEEITVTAKKKVLVQLVEGDLLFLSYQDADGETVRKAATTFGALTKMLEEVLGLEKKVRKPRKAKGSSAAE